MPFEAAKAMAATFCYSIRYALTPLFGVDFLSLCVKPEDPKFALMVIDSKIVRDCTASARAFCALSRGASHGGTPSMKPASSLKTWSPKSPRVNLNSPADSESGYGTDTDRSDKYFSSPQTPRTTGWTALNTPVSSTRTNCGTPSPPKRCVSTSPVKYEESLKRLGCDDIRDGKRHCRGRDDDDDQESDSSQSSKGLRKGPKRRRVTTIQTKETHAAYMLMQLRLADPTLSISSNGPDCRYISP